MHHVLTKLTKRQQEKLAYCEESVLPLTYVRGTEIIAEPAGKARQRSSIAKQIW